MAGSDTERNQEVQDTGAGLRSEWEHRTVMLCSGFRRTTSAVTEQFSIKTLAGCCAELGDGDGDDEGRRWEPGVWG